MSSVNEPCMSLMSVETRKLSGTGVIWSCEPTGECWELNQNRLEGQLVLLTTEVLSAPPPAASLDLRTAWRQGWPRFSSFLLSFHLLSTSMLKVCDVQGTGCAVVSNRKSLLSENVLFCGRRWKTKGARSLPGLRRLKWIKANSIKKSPLLPAGCWHIFKHYNFETPRRWPMILFSCHTVYVNKS